MRDMALKAVAVAATAIAGCGGGSDQPEPRPVTNDRASVLVGQLADEIRWGCGNVPRIRQAAGRVEAAVPRMTPAARPLAREAVAEARGVAQRCP